MAPTPKRNDPAEWDQVAADYEAVNEPFMAGWAEQALAVANVTSNDRVLDVASGPGTLAVRAARIARSVVATDYSDGMLARLRARVERETLTNVEVRKMNGQELELASESFEAAFSAFGLIFFPDRARGFSELHRVLVPGGRAVITGWGPMDRSPILAAMMRGIREALPELPKPDGPIPAFSLADPATFAAELVEAGFDDVEVTVSPREIALGGTVEAFFDQQTPANVLCAALQPKLPAEVWSRVRDTACRRMREALGDGPVVLRGEANVGIGWKPAGDDA